MTFKVENADKVRVLHDGVYETFEGVKNGVYPLVHGAETYTIYIMRKVHGSQYITDGTMRVYLLPAEVNSFASEPNSYIQSDSSEVIQLMNQLVKPTDSVLTKLQAFQKYCLKTIVYDYIKAVLKRSIYVPDNAKTIKSKSGICWDKASLLQRYAGRLVFQLKW